MDLKVIIKDGVPRLKSYFSALPWKSMLAFLFFLLVAFIFWLMLFFQKQNIEGTYRVPLKYTNIPEDVVFDNPLPAYIDVSVSDNGAEIFRLDIRKKDSLEIDFASLTEDGTTLIQGEQFRQLLRGKFASGTIIRGYYPMTLSLATSKLESKELTVAFDGELTTSRANLVADSVTFIPETVMAYGSKESLDKLKVATTVKFPNFLS
jgi:hypothetical protein